MSRRLSTIAHALETQYPELCAVIDEWTWNTDRKLAGTRLRRPGKGRRGNRLRVFYRNRPDTSIFEHRASETYRTNAEVEAWVIAYADCKQGKHWKFSPDDPSCHTCQRPV